MKTIAIALCALTAASGCSIHQANYETAPVVVATRSGDVTCQLYTKQIVMWDEAIDIPAGMPLDQADRICLYAGERQKRGEDPRITHPNWAPLSPTTLN